MLAHDCTPPCICVRTKPACAVFEASPLSPNRIPQPPPPQPAPPWTGPEASQISIGGNTARGSQAGDSGLGGLDDIDEEAYQLTPEALEARLISLLETCTYTVFSYTRRGLFDRDKLIVLSLLTFAILLRSQVRAAGQGRGRGDGRGGSSSSAGVAR